MEFYEWKFQTLYPRVAEQLLALGYGVHQAHNKGEALQVALHLIAKERKVGLGSTQTLEQIGLMDSLRQSGRELLGVQADQTEAENLRQCRAALTAKVFVTGVNAITRSGQLLFVDTLGNRAAAVLFGPERVVVIAGMNKVVPDVDVALKRLRGSDPAQDEPQDAEGPCVHTGECADCHAPHRICNSLTIVENTLRVPGRIQVVLVMEQLGI